MAVGHYGVLHTFNCGNFLYRLLILPYFLNSISSNFIKLRHFSVFHQIAGTLLQDLKPQSHIHGFGPGRATVHPDLSNRGASA